MGIRIGVGKKIGGVYVGASTNIGGRKGGGKKGGNGGCFLTCIAILFFPITLLYLLGKWLYNTTQNQLAINPDKVWFKQNWGIILSLVVFFPVGIYLMWKYSNWNKYVKISVSVVFALFMVYCFIFGEPIENSNIDNNSSLSDIDKSVLPTATKEYTSENLLLAFDDEETGESLIGETIQVTGELKYDPTDSKITLETTGANLDGFIYCEMSEYSEDFSTLKEDECVVIVGTIEREFAHVYMVDCWYIGIAEEDNNDESSTSDENLSAEGNSIKQYGTTDDMNVIVAKAEEDAITATQEDIDEALNWLNENNSHLFDSQGNIEQTMYYGNLLDYYYKDTDEDLAYLGFKAFETVKYVYRGVDSVLDDVTHDNLMEVKDLLAEQSK